MLGLTNLNSNSTLMM